MRDGNAKGDVGEKEKTPSHARGHFTDADRVGSARCMSIKRERKQKHH